MHQVDDIDFQLQYGGTFLLTLGQIICITRPDTNFFWIVWWAKICCITPYFSWKSSTWNKGNKDGNSSPDNCCLIIVYIAVFRQKISTFCWLCKETRNNKHDWTPIKYLNVFHHNRKQKQLQFSFLNIL